MLPVIVLAKVAVPLESMFTTSAPPAMTKCTAVPPMTKSLDIEFR